MGDQAITDAGARPPRREFEWWHGRTLRDGLAQPRDNFLSLRFVAAMLVVYGHGYAMTAGEGLPELFSWLGWGTYSGSIGVDLFFVASGFLVTGSFLRRSVAGGLWARAVRIVPAYACCVLVSALLVGPILTTLPLWDYFRHPQVRGFLMNLRFAPAFVADLPGVFVDNPRRATFNGSLWTLPIEVRMYLWVGLLRGAGILNRRWLCNAALAAMVLWVGLSFGWLPLISRDWMPLGGLFALGVFSYVNQDRVPLGWGWFVGLVLLASAVRWTALYPFAFGVSEAYFVFCFAYCTPVYGVDRTRDYSYGIYLWAFPVQQVVAQHAPLLSPVLNAICTLPIVMLLGAASWHLLEKPALKMKNAIR